jgi:hypothetical protein
MSKRPKGHAFPPTKSYDDYGYEDIPIVSDVDLTQHWTFFCLGWGRSFAYSSRIGDIPVVHFTFIILISIDAISK